MNKRFLIVLFAAGQFTFALGVRAGVYDVAADFSTNSNPNGVWSYGYATVLGGSLILYTDNTSRSTPDVIGWCYNIAYGVPAVFYNRTANTVSIGSPTLAPYQAVFHPGPNDEYSIYRFTAPAAGNYLLQAAFAGVDTAGTTTDVHVLFNDSSIFDGSVNGFGPGTGPSFSTNLVLQANDRIDFEVGYGNNGFYNDSTGLQATLISSPQLSIQGVSAAQTQLSWSTNFTGFLLESASNLPATAWFSVTNSRTTNGQQFTVTIDTIPGEQFYRLKKD